MGMTLGKIQSFIREQYCLEISTGELSEMIKRVASRYEAAWQDIKTSLLEQPHLYADETGWRIDGDNGWLWSFANKDLSFYIIDRSRGQHVVNEVLGETYNGVLITDFYGAYNAIDCDKQKCWVHLCRDLKELKEKFLKNREIEVFADRIKAFYNRAIKLQASFKDGQNIEKQLERLKNDTLRWAGRKHRHKDLKRLAKRIHKYRGELYTFIKSGADPTNNFGEREIRPAVLMRKTSYCNRSENGAKNQSILMSVIRSVEKQGLNFVESATEHMQTLH